MKRWTQRPEGSNWGDFGEDDQIGRLNLITPERRLAAVREVRHGLAFMLSLPLDYPGGELQPAYRHPPKLASTLGEHNLEISRVFDSPQAIDIANDDVVTLCTQYSTQWDSLCHIGSYFDCDADGMEKPVYYNGYRAGESVVSRDAQGNSNAHALGIDAMATCGVQGRGVLVNLRKVYGENKVVVGYDAMMRVLEAQNVVVEPGDLLCVYTGFADLVLSMNKNPDVQRLRNSFADLDGHDERLLQWITDTGLAAICSDTQAVECHPDSQTQPARNGRHPFFPLHHHCLFKLGVHLGEFWYFEELAAWLDANGRNRFLLTAPPLRLPGAVGSPVTPVATV